MERWFTDDRARCGFGCLKGGALLRRMFLCCLRTRLGMNSDAKLFDRGMAEEALERLRGCEALAGDVTGGEGEGDRFRGEGIGA